MADNQQVLKCSGSVSEYRKECHNLLISLKTTVEGLLALPCNNVWSTFGGLDRLAKSIESILSHRLKINQSCDQEVFWHFVRGLRWLNPTSAPAIDRLNRISVTVRGQQWLRETLETHNLSSQLSILVGNRQHLLQHYHAEAFLCQPDYFFAMLVCLNAVEQNCPALLAEINPAMLYQPKSFKRLSHVRSNSLPFIVLSAENSGRASNRLARPDSSQSIALEGHQQLIQYDQKVRLVTLDSDHEVRSSLYDAVSVEALSELSDSDHIIGRINDPLMNFYATSSAEKLKHSQLKLGPSVSSEMLDDPYGLSVPETPPLSDLSPLFSALPVQDPSLPYVNAVHKRDSNNASELHDSKLHSQDETLKNYCSDDQITQKIRRKVLSRVKEHDAKSFDHVQKYNFSDICMEDELTVANKARVEVSQLQNMDQVLDMILNNDDLDIQSVKADSGIESLATQVTKSSINFQKTENSGMQTSDLHRNCNESALDNGIRSTKGFWIGSNAQNDFAMPRNVQSSFTKVSTVTLSSSLPSTVRGKSDRTGHQGFFHPPLEGQSLLSFLSSQDFHTCTDLDRESAHFSIAEALIAAVEQMKWNQTITPKSELEHEECDSDEEIQKLKQRIRIRRSERLKEKARQFPGGFDHEFEEADQMTGSISYSDSYPSFESLSPEAEYSSSSEDIHDAEINDVDAKGQQSNLLAMRESGLSLSMASLYSDADIQRSLASVSTGKVEPQTSLREGLTVSGSHQTSADSIAISLLKQFSEKQLPKASDLIWLVSERDAPQQLLPLPDSYPISPDDGENSDLQPIHQQNRLRGNLDWAPPRPQIISSIHPKLSQNIVIAKQNHRCAGCGSKVEKGYARRYRYCEYLGKYFCQCCHSNDRAYIPGRILRKWDFGKYHVSHFANEFLKRIYDEPVFSVESKSTGLYQKVPALEEMREMRIQLHYLAPFIQTCKQSTKPSLDAIPSHWFANLNYIHYYSISELVEVKKKELVSRIKEVLTQCVTHISQCLLCQGKGFICEICRNGSDIIYPFEIGRVVICPGCQAAFHHTCYAPGSGSCPKCTRISSRKQKHKLQEPNQLH